MDKEEVAMRGSRYTLAYAFLALGVAAAAFGIVRGEHLAVLEKATTLCLECLGLRP